jgi:hypothetical protein
MSNQEGQARLKWVGQFRSVVTEYHKHRRPDPFMEWFRAQISAGMLEDAFSKVLIILVDARFDQAGIRAEGALENTITVFSSGLLRRKHIEPNDVPSLEVPPFKKDRSNQNITPSKWARRFRTAYVDLVQKAETISTRKTWSANELLHFLLAKPKPLDLGIKTARLAVRWLHELVPELTIDMSDSGVPVDRNLYRVAARLGIIDPVADKYFGEGSPADNRVQRFAVEAFSQNPSLIDEPMWMEARSKADFGHCHTIPDCEGCIFERICLRKYMTTDPISIGFGG